MSDARVDLREPRATCEAVRTSGGAIFRWEWDDRLGAVLSPFRRSDGPAVHALLERSFGGVWDSATIGTAAPAVLAMVQSLGGLRPGQKLFVSAPDRAVGTCACWWPWGDGETVSVRIMLLAGGVPDTERAALVAELRSWFSV
jgi:hypothetical protein